MKKIVIAGGGISGLTARYYLSRKYPDAEITLYEKSDRLGGVVHSVNEGFFFERGPRTFKVSRSQALLSLIHELGLEEEILYSSKTSQKRYLWKNRKLSLMQTFFPKMIPALLKEWKKPYPWGGDESIETFVTRRLGSYVAETFFDPLTLGIYAGDIRKLSIRSCFPTLKALEMEHGSLTKGWIKSKRTKEPKGLFTLKGGLTLLIQKLAEKGRGEICLNTPYETLQHGVDRHILALPLSAMPFFFQFDPEACSFFESMESVSLSAVNVAFNKKVLKKKGFGYLVPSSEKEEILGVIFDSCVFPTQNHRENETRLTVMLKESHPEVAREKALRALHAHLGISEAPAYCHVQHYPHAIPQYLVGHQERARAFLNYLSQTYPQLTCIGNYLQGVSLNDCISIASKAT
jgi:oxygen-dependent protoporphyrinogen oxidase